jgi:ubiquinone biosynthesis protein UbiJ
LEIKTQKIDGILKFYEKIKNLSKSNTIIKKELVELNLKKVQVILNSPHYTYWVIFGNGIFNYGKGEIENADIIVKSKFSLMKKILNQKKMPHTEFVKKNLQVEGDVQYAVVYFDFINFALDQNKKKELE